MSSQAKERPKNEIRNAIQLYRALFETMKDAHDSRYISRKHKKNIIFIPLQERGITTEFSLSRKDKLLIHHGRDRARNFLSPWAYQINS